MNSISSSIYTNLCPKQCYVNASQWRERPIASSEFGVLLQSCIDARSFDRAKNLHFRIREAGFEKNRDLLPKLVKLYSVCGRIDVARQLFDKMRKRNLDVFVWTAIICGYVSNGNPIEGVKLFVEMLAVGVRPDSYSFSALLKASADLGLLRVIQQLHSMMVKCGRCSSLSVANSLIHAYGSFGDVDCATKVFDRIENRDVVSWSSMIQACSRIENHAESLSLFSAMQFEEFVRPNELTIVSLLPACGFYSSLRKGRAIHAFAIRNGFRENLIVGSALVSMYSRCGEPEIAYGVFKSLERRNIILWTSMIEGSALNGKFDLAMDLFKTMQECGLKPNYVTLVVVLSACSHGGLVDEGLKILKTMPQKFGVKPGIEHYACVVDMLGRVGRLVEAEKFIQGMSIKPSASVLGCLLGACQVHGNVEIGERLACKLFEIEPKNAANYIILSNIYASSGRWDGARHVRRLMSERGLSKETGCSWIEIGHEVHVFRAHD